MKIASWNVNSLRVRLPHVLDWLETEQPDLLGLQELKMTDEQFPETDIQAAASFYGGGIAAPQGPGGAESTLSRTSKIVGRLECYFGGQDLLIPTDQVDSIRKALGDAGVDHDVQIYAEADHGFNCDQRATYNEAAATDAWQRTFKMFGEQLAG